MTSPPIPDAIIAAYFRDGEWQYQLMQIVLVWCGASSSHCKQLELRRRRRRKEKPLPKPPPSWSLTEVLEAMCTSELQSQTLQVEQDLVV